MTFHGDDAYRACRVDVAHDSVHTVHEQAALRPRRPARRLGYARVPSSKQADLKTAVTALTTAGVASEDIHLDRANRLPASKRLGWRDVSAALQPGDLLVVPALINLARSAAELRRLLEWLQEREVRLEVGGIVETQPSPADMDALRVQLLHELQEVWREKCSGSGRHPPRPDHERLLAVVELFDEGLPRTYIAARLGLSRPSIYRLAAGEALG